MIAYKIEGVTIAVTNMEAMRTFYEKLFGIDFEEKRLFGSLLYSGYWGILNLLLCPAEIAKNSATQNRHQFEIIVQDIQKAIKLAVRNGGTKMGEISEDKDCWSIGIYDPDNNSMVLKQTKD